MFEPQPGPRVFALPPGADFSRRFAEGLLARAGALPPFALARTRLLVNTNRTGRRLRELLAAEGARLLPQIRAIPALALEPGPGFVPPLPALGRRLQLARLILALLDRDPTLAPRAAAFDLAERLARLIDEMHEEQVPPEALTAQDFGALSVHWQQSARILELAVRQFDAPSAAALLAARVARLTEQWGETPAAGQAAPPAGTSAGAPGEVLPGPEAPLPETPPPETPLPEAPLIVAGSTGSRGTTFRLMLAAARLPQGAVVLPGFDFGASDALWAQLVAERAEDHPQYRFARLLEALGLPPGAVQPWTGDRTPSPRGRLLSLALRPAPASDQWIREGPALGDLTEATRGLTLIEAETPRAEALAIAALAREAVHRGKMAAVVTPDRALTRMIAAELSRWGIAADDSAGEPLALTAQGRLLRHVAELLVEPARLETMLVLLKHPLVHAGPGRGLHLERSRRLELALRREGQPWPTADELMRLAARLGDPAWARWLVGCLTGQTVTGALPLAALLERHLALAERLSAGPEAADTSGVPDGVGGAGAPDASGEPDAPGGPGVPGSHSAPDGAGVPGGLGAPGGSGATDAPDAPDDPTGPRLWAGAAGRRARAEMEALAREAGRSGPLTAREYGDLLADLLGRAELRSQAEAHTGVRFWGTIEARIQGADLTILAGLNEGRWPARPAPDPWLNRAMRKRLGLTLPERRIGLAAHDFQQAAAAPQVVLSRALRDQGAQTVPARWLNRLTNLLAGLPATGAPALEEMRGRGAWWLALAARLDQPARRLPAAPRPAPAPPPARRPRQLSVTELQVLVRDPYAIYARHVLGLSPLDPLRPQPDAAARGTVVHRAIEHFLTASRDDPAAATLAAFAAATEAALAEEAPWPGIRALWRGRLAALAPWLVAEEAARRALGRPLVIERRARWPVPGLGLGAPESGGPVGGTPAAGAPGPGAPSSYAPMSGALPAGVPESEGPASAAPWPGASGPDLARPGALPDLPAAGFALIGKPDRIDLLADGSVEVVDYKTGGPPGAREIRHFDRQLLLLALMAEGGAFGRPYTVSALAHVGLGTRPVVARLALDGTPLAQVRAELVALLRAYADPAQGYLARRAQEGARWAGDYDHLARFGEWSASDPGQPLPVGTAEEHDTGRDGSA